MFATKGNLYKKFKKKERMDIRIEKKSETRVYSDGFIYHL